MNHFSDTSKGSARAVNGDSLNTSSKRQIDSQSRYQINTEASSHTLHVSVELSTIHVQAGVRENGPPWPLHFCLCVKPH